MDAFVVAIDMGGHSLRFVVHGNLGQTAISVFIPNQDGKNGSYQVLHRGRYDRGPLRGRPYALVHEAAGGAFVMNSDFCA